MQATTAQAARHDPLTQARPGHPPGVTLNVTAAGFSRLGSIHQPIHHEQDTNMHAGPDSDCGHETALHSDVAEAVGMDTVELASQILGDTAVGLWDFDNSAVQAGRREEVDCEKGSSHEAAQALRELEDFCKCRLSNRPSLKVVLGLADSSLCLCLPQQTVHCELLLMHTCFACSAPPEIIIAICNTCLCWCASAVSAVATVDKVCYTACDVALQAIITTQHDYMLSGRGARHA